MFVTSWFVVNCFTFCLCLFDAVRVVWFVSLTVFAVGGCYFDLLFGVVVLLDLVLCFAYWLLLDLFALVAYLFLCYLVGCFVLVVWLFSLITLVWLVDLLLSFVVIACLCLVVCLFCLLTWLFWLLFACSFGYYLVGFCFGCGCLVF